jgi:DNA-binding Lrp family transcriptional regulator
LQAQGVIKRFGVIVKHAAVGYCHNAMVVWHVPEAKIDAIAAQLLTFSFVTLCYQRPMLAQWPYNLYCMIHWENSRSGA